eukprot:SAG11_NODE_1940_length_4027_cov_4.230652_1_plen_283_part_00
MLKSTTLKGYVDSVIKKKAKYRVEWVRHDTGETAVDEDLEAHNSFRPFIMTFEAANIAAHKATQSMKKTHDDELKLLKKNASYDKTKVRRLMKQVTSLKRDLDTANTTAYAVAAYATTQTQTIEVETVLEENEETLRGRHGSQPLEQRRTVRRRMVQDVGEARSVEGGRYQRTQERENTVDLVGGSQRRVVARPRSNPRENSADPIEFSEDDRTQQQSVSSIAESDWNSQFPAPHRSPHSQHPAAATDSGAQPTHNTEELLDFRTSQRGDNSRDPQINLGGA